MVYSKQKSDRASISIIDLRPSEIAVVNGGLCDVGSFCDDVLSVVFSSFIPGVVMGYGVLLSAGAAVIALPVLYISRCILRCCKRKS